MPGVTSIHKDILKREHAASPLGKLERAIGKIYDNLKLQQKKLPEDVSKKIYDIRDAQEKEMNEYVEMTLKRDREAGDEILTRNMTKELKVLEEYLSLTP